VCNGHKVQLHKAVIRFLNGLDPAAWAYSMELIESLSELGLTREFKQLRKVQGDLWEICADTEKPNRRFIRYMFVARKGEFLVTNAYNKQTNKTPLKEIKLAFKRAKE